MRLHLRDTRRPTLRADGYRPDIQGIRAIAVLLVVLCHAGVPLLHGGFVGVDVFFVVSGFLITGWLVRRMQRDGRVPFASFYAARARRILPAASLVLVVTAIGSLVFLNYVRALTAIHDCVWATFFAANIHFARVGTDYFASTDPPSPVQQFWTLAVEEQFYLVWPALLALVWFGLRRTTSAPEFTTGTRRALAGVIALVVVLSFAWSCWQTSHEQTIAYFSTLTRAWELGVGAMLALIAPEIGARTAPHRAWLARAGFVGIAVAAVTFSSSTAFPGFLALLPVASAGLLIAAGLEATPTARDHRVLCSRPFVLVGDVSYSFYLWHWPALVIAAEYLGHPLSVGVNVALVSAAFIVSAATTKLFEDPIRHSSRLRRPSLGLALWPITVAATLGVVALSSHAIHQRLDRLAASIEPAARAAATRQAEHQAKTVAPQLPPAEALVAWSSSAKREAKPVPDALSPLVQDLAGDIYPLGRCGASDGDTSSTVCRMGDTSATRVIGVFGDSHAQMWLPGLIRYARAHKYALMPLTKDGCATVKWLHPDGGDECVRWDRWALDELRRVHPAAIVVGESYSDAWRAGNGDRVELGLANELAAVRSVTPDVVLIGDPPNLPKEPTDCLLAHGATLGSCTFPLIGWGRADDDTAAMASTADVAYLPTLRWFCTEDACPTVIGTTIAYRDSTHISRAYATQLAAPFSASLGALLRRMRA